MFTNVNYIEHETSQNLIRVDFSFFVFLDTFYCKQLVIYVYKLNFRLRFRYTFKSNIRGVTTSVNYQVRIVIRKIIISENNDGSSEDLSSFRSRILKVLFRTLTLKSQGFKWVSIFSLTLLMFFNCSFV